MSAKSSDRIKELQKAFTESVNPFTLTCKDTRNKRKLGKAIDYMKIIPPGAKSILLFIWVTIFVIFSFKLATTPDSIRPSIALGLYLLGSAIDIIQRRLQLYSNVYGVVLSICTMAAILILLYNNIAPGFLVLPCVTILGIALFTITTTLTKWLVLAIVLVITLIGTVVIIIISDAEIDQASSCSLSIERRVISIISMVALYLTAGAIVYAFEYLHRMYCFLYLQTDEWKSMLDRLPYGVAIIDGQGHIIYTNVAIMEFTTKDTCTLSSQKRRLLLEEFFDQSLSFKDGKYLRDFIFKPKTKEPLVGEIRNDKGEKLMTVEAEWFSLKFDSIPCKAIILKNVTAFEELQQQKIEQKYLRFLLASVTHDLRTPLNGVFGMLELLEQENISEIGWKYLKIAKNTAELALYLVHDLLDFSRIEANSFSLMYERVEIPAVVEECIALYEDSFAKKGISLTASYDPSLPSKVVIDKSRYKQILLNLISNAFKFTPKGGVTIKVKYDYLKDTLSTSVTDTGVGIKSECMDKLFKLYSKIEDPQGLNPKGVGLGLTICKKLVEQHGGNISVSSVAGEGTTFEFTVRTHPRASINNKEEKVVAKKYLPTPVQEKRECIVNLERRPSDVHRKCINNETMSTERECGCAKILLVDDTETNLVALKAFSKVAGIPAESAYNGEEAVKMVKAKANRCKECGEANYRVIFMDINMPIMDGVEATQEINRLIREGEIPHTPIIALSAGDVDEEDCAEIGFATSVSKPISKSKFIQTASMYLGKGSHV